MSSRVLLFGSQDVFEQPPGRDVLVTQPADDLAVRLYGHPLCDQVLPDHFDQSEPSTYSEWLRVASPSGLKLGSP